jgi:hypothetical protein
MTKTTKCIPSKRLRVKMKKRIAARRPQRQLFPSGLCAEVHGKKTFIASIRGYLQRVFKGFNHGFVIKVKNSNDKSGLIRFTRELKFIAAVCHIRFFTCLCR